jgi:hypothetical protein
MKVAETLLVGTRENTFMQIFGLELAEILQTTFASCSTC